MEVEESTSLAELLLSCPQPADETFTKDLVRATCSYEDLSRSFRVPVERKYGVQYSHIYYYRLQRMRKRLVAAAERKWGQSLECPALLPASVICVVTGGVRVKQSIIPFPDSTNNIILC